jgi:hypothetical protein
MSSRTTSPEPTVRARRRRSIGRSRRLLIRCKETGLVYIPTSPYSKVGAAYELYQQGLMIDEGSGKAANPDFLVIRLPSWGFYEDWDDLEATEGRVFVSPPQRLDDDLAERGNETRTPSGWSTRRSGRTSKAAISTPPWSIGCSSRSARTAVSRWETLLSAIGAAPLHER